MRKIAAVLILFAASAAFGEMTPEEHLEHLREVLHAMSQHGPVVPQPQTINAQSAKTIDMTAVTFAFTPNEFTVNQGDVVTVNVTVPSSDHSPANPNHILLMETYIEQGLACRKGQTASITFVATMPGNFEFACGQPSCGNGHSSMFGRMIVVANTNPAPTISALVPTSGLPSGGTAVTINGANFVSGATVTFGGSAATNVNVSDAATITATTPAHAEGAVDVAVTNPDGQTATLSNGFTYAALKVASVTPNSGSTAGGTNVTIAGSAFQNGATVSFGAMPASNVNVVDSNTIVATTPLGPATEELAVDVVVKNPDGTSATLTHGFTYSVPPLSVASIAPAVGLPSGGTIVTISGAGFTTAVTSSVTFGGVPATSVAILSPVTMQVTAPAHANGTVDVVVTVGGLSVTKTAAFTFATPPPRHRSVKH